MSSGSLSVVSVRRASASIGSGSTSTSTACYPSSTINTPVPKTRKRPTYLQKGILLSIKARNWTRAMLWAHMPPRPITGRLD